MLEQLIVLGQIPGTTIQLNFVQVLAMIVSVGAVLYVHRELRKAHTNHTSKQQ